jgi:hypothetical protein
VQNRPWILRTLLFEGVQLERGEDWFEQFFYLPLFNSVAKRKLILGRNNIWAGGQLPPPLTHPHVTHTHSRLICEQNTTTIDDDDDDNDNKQTKVLSH